MKKIIVIILVVLAVVVWGSIDLISDIYNDRSQGLTEAQRLATQTTGWKVIDVSRFHGLQLYYIFTMQDENEQLYYVVTDEQNQVTYFPYIEINFDQDEAHQRVSQEYPGYQVKSIRPAYVNQGLCWEVVAQDEEDRFHYVYYAMKDGQFVKRYILENTLRLS